MKKLKLALVTLLAFLVGAFGLVACGKDKEVSYPGTYKFESLRVTSNGVTVEMQVGQKFMDVIELSADFVVMELKEDGTAVMTMRGESMNGSWEKSETESGKLVITFEEESQTVECDGTILKIEEEDIGLITLKKA